MAFYAVIVCGGDATRMGPMQTSKTLIPVNGVPAVIRCLHAFRKAGCECVLVIRPSDEALFRKALLAWHADAKLVYGGADRQASVKNGLDAIEDRDAFVLIHDGARPMITPAFVADCMQFALEHGSAVPAVPVTDTLKKCTDGDVKTVSREGLYRTQTPQCFRLQDLLKAYALADGSYTDEAALFEHAGLPMCLCRGMAENVKLTQREDIALAERLSQKIYRTGFGLDAHRFEKGRKLILCGVEVPYDRGLLGHSDADAPLHALTDALLGAAAMGDIGQWFPDTDERFRGISSVLLLKRVAQHLCGKGIRIVNADVTIVCQRPKLMPYIDAMRRTTAEALGVPTACVSVKATTTEHMGYEGREEGISAHAVATVAVDPLMTEMEAEHDPE